MRIELKHAFAMLPRPFIVCGTRLLPMRIGHALLLIRLQNPLFGFECESSDIPAAVAQVVQVCSRPAIPAIELAENESLERQCAQWLLALASSREKIDFIEIFEQLIEYRAEAFKKLAPDISVDANKRGGISDTPLLHHLLLTLCTECSLDFFDALEVEISRALWFHLGILERRGALEIRDADAITSAIKRIPEIVKQETTTS